MREAGEDIHDIASEAADALGQNQVNFASLGILNHFLKAFPLVHRGAADAFIRVYLDHLVIRIVFNFGCEVLHLHLKAASLCVLLCTDSAVRRHTHLGGFLKNILFALRHDDTAFALTAAILGNGLLD